MRHDIAILVLGIFIGVIFGFIIAAIVGGPDE